MNIEIQNTPQNIVSLVTPKLKLLPEFFNNITIASASGEKVGFMNTVGLPLRFVDVATEIVAAQSGIGDPSPDNIRPISGWTGANITVNGKNFVQKTIQGYQINSTGTISFNSNYDVQVGAIKKGETYTITNGNSDVVMAFYTSEPSIGSVSYDTNRVVQASHTFIAPIDGYVGFRTNASCATPQLEVGSTETDYEPYKGRTYPVTWSDEAGTVYGGEVDVTKGKLTKTWEGKDMGDINWTRGSSDVNGRFRATPSPSMENPTTAAERATGILSSVYPSSANTSLSDLDDRSMLRYNGEIFVRDTSYNNDSAAFKTAMAGNILIYKLATPVEYDITPVDAIKMLNGQNFVWSNTGDISVVYYKKVGANDNVQTLMRSSAPSLGMERQEVEDRPLEDIRLGDGLIREVLEPIEREEIEDEPVEIAEEEPQDEEPVEEPQEEVNEDER